MNTSDKQIYLRPLSHDDAKISWRWRNDHDIWKYTFGHPEQHVSQEMEEQWIDKVLNDANRLNFAICLQENNQYIGNIYLININWTEKSGEQGTFIGEKAFWGMGIGTRARQLMYEIVLKEYGIRRIYSKIRNDNLASIKSLLKCGFVVQERHDEYSLYFKDLTS